MVYLINLFVMRNFAYKNTDFLKDDFTPELVEGHPCYQASVYDALYRDWETDRKSTRLNSSHSAKSRMPSSA